MKWALLLVTTLMVFAVGLSDAATEDAQESEFDAQAYMREKIVVILGGYADFESAKKQALVISKASKKPFSMQGMIYDTKKGLRLPEDDPDEIYAGSYFHRRYNTAVLGDNGESTEYLSIELSGAYDGFTPGYFIIVGGIYNDSEEAKAALAQFKPIVADAYSKKTKIYMGCMH